MMLFSGPKRGTKQDNIWNADAGSEAAEYRCDWRKVVGRGDKAQAGGRNYPTQMRTAVVIEKVAP